MGITLKNCLLRAWEPTQKPPKHNFLGIREGLRFPGSQAYLLYPISTEAMCRDTKLSSLVYSCFACAVQAKCHSSFGICKLEDLIAIGWMCICWGGSLSTLFCTVSSRSVEKVRKGMPFSPWRGLMDWIPCTSPQVCPTLLHFPWLVPDPSLHSCLAAPYKLPCCLLMQDVRHYTFSTVSQGTFLTTSGL